MSKKMSPLSIMNTMGAAAHKKARLPKEGSPAEEASESPEEAAAEAKAGKKPKLPSAKKSPFPPKK